MEAGDYSTGGACHKPKEALVTIHFLTASNFFFLMDDNCRDGIPSFVRAPIAWSDLESTVRSRCSGTLEASGAQAPGPQGRRAVAARRRGAARHLGVPVRPRRRSHGDRGAVAR